MTALPPPVRRTMIAMPTGPAHGKTALRDSHTGVAPFSAPR